VFAIDIAAKWQRLSLVAKTAKLATAAETIPFAAGCSSRKGVMAKQMANMQLVRDSFLPWEGPFPYEHLDRRLREVGHRGLDPSASAEQIRDDVLFELMSAGEVTGADQQAWNELRLLDRRLLLDFFHYRLDDATAQEVKQCQRDRSGGAV
jgi:hypothetical protein